MSKIYKAQQGLEWNAIGWLSKRVAKPDKTKYTQKDINNPYKYAYINMKKEDYNLYARKWKHELGGVLKKLEQGGLLSSSYTPNKMESKKVYLPEEIDEPSITLPQFEAIFPVTSKESKIVLPKYDEAPSTYTSQSEYDVTPQAKEGDENKTISEILNEEGIKHKVTSAYRPNAVTRQGRPSRHGKLDANGNPLALDIVPLDGDFDNFRKQIYSNPRVVAWLRSHKWGILEELAHMANGDSGYYDPDTGVFKATGKNQGNHFHFGGDNAAIRTSQKHMNYA